jgi:DNA-binding response OmpR family regulator
VAEPILEISDRAADLVRQLLRFSRKEPARHRPTDVNELVRRVEGILRHTLDPRIALQVHTASAACLVLGDASQLESALLNLAVNARDAMRDGGELSIATRIAEMDALAVSGLDCALAPGRYVEVAVLDTGCGIAPDVMDHIFEPFFTTKEAGQGTGLGLSAVYGTIHAHQGGIHVHSEVGKGTSFRLFVPYVDEQPQAVASAEPIAGSGRLLLVDDEEGVRETASQLLTGLGYTVQAFARPRDALAYFEKHHAVVDGVILDMLMPQLNGAQVVERMRHIQPDVRVLIASGFLGVGEHGGALVRGLPMVRKPFNLVELALAVHQLLQRREVLVVQA